ncbi:UNVERIFIED_CONTAM: hypothetical protein FKN15_004816 [Acipenser sinensis]
MQRRGRQPIDIRLSVMAVTRRGLPIESITGAEALVESCGDGEPQKKKRATEQSISSSRGETLGSPVASVLVQRFCAWCLVPRHLGLVRVGARSVLGASTLSARTSTLDARCTHLDARRSVHAPRRSTLGARTSTLDARCTRTSTLDASALDARCTHLDASMLSARISTLGAHTSTLDATRVDASTLGARTSTLDASAHRRSVHAPRRLGARRLDARCTRLDARCSHLDARRLGARRLDARCTHLDARRLGARRLDARCTHLDARRLGARRLDARCTHLDARRLGARSALADRSFCALCANFQPRTLRQRARKAVGNHSPSSGSSFTLSVPPSSTVTAVTLRGSKSPSQLTAGQRSPDRRRAHERSHSPSIRPHGSSPRRERSRRSRSRSLSPQRRGRSRSPRWDRRCRDKSGMAELMSKMSQFMEVMMGQQSLLMSLTNRAPPAEPVASHSAFSHSLWPSQFSNNPKGYGT